MKSMKNLSMNRMLGSVRRRPDAADGVPAPAPATGAGAGAGAMVPQQPIVDTPEANASRGVKSFCESGGPGGQQGEEVLYLPTIVEAAESSPTAAKECAHIIRKYLSKDNFTRPHVQYNGIMLVRILADNPGPSFTKNLDAKFVTAVKDLLRMGRDPSVKQILIETLDNFEREKRADTNLNPLVEMWKKEQVKMAKVYGPKGQPGPRALTAPPHQNQNYFSRNHQTSRRLPAPEELASRIEEARTSAKLLTQVVQSTPPDEFLQSDLIREFADRCQSASRSIQGYMVTENPSPDNDTMLTLIETNDQLAMAMSKHQRAVLMARKVMGINDVSSPSGSIPGDSVAPPPGPPPSQNRASEGAGAAPPVPSRKQLKKNGSGSDSRKALPSNPNQSSEAVDDPFRDPTAGPIDAPFPKDRTPPMTDQFQDRLGVEPYHPGFNPTKSYMGRQDSAVGKVSMHAAGPESPVSENDYAGDVSPREKNGHEDSKETPIYRY